MNAQLTGQIISLILLGLVLFIALAYVVAKTVEHVLTSYFSAKLTYMKLLMREEPPDTFMETVRAVAKHKADELARKDFKDL